MTTPAGVRTIEVVERLHVIATHGEAVTIGGVLVHLVTARGLVTVPPRLTIEPDWGDTCNVLESWTREHPGEGSPESPDDVFLPRELGVWRINLALGVTGSENEIDDVAFAALAEVVDACIRCTVESGAVERTSPSEGVPYFSLVTVPDLPSE